MGNLAVLGNLEGESIQPSNFIQGEDNYLNLGSKSRKVAGPPGVLFAKQRFYTGSRHYKT